MKRPYQITGAVFFLFAALIARESLDLKFYTTLGPGPGFFPFWLSILMMILAGTMFVQATYGKSDPMPADFFASKVGYLRFLAICAASIFMVYAMDPLGFRLTMLIFFGFLMVTLGRVKWFYTVGIPIIGAWGCFWLFNDMLKVPLPLGMFGF